MAEAAGGRRVGLRLARLPFAAPERAAQLLGSAPLSWWDAARNAPTDEDAARLIETIARGADPDGALEALTEIAGRPEGADLPAALRADEGLAERLLAVLGVSAALAEHLRTHPGDWQVLADDAGSEGAASGWQRRCRPIRPIP